MKFFRTRDTELQVVTVTFRKMQINEIYLFYYLFNIG